MSHAVSQVILDALVSENGASVRIAPQARQRIEKEILRSVEGGDFAACADEVLVMIGFLHSRTETKPAASDLCSLLEKVTPLLERSLARKGR